MSGTPPSWHRLRLKASDGVLLVLLGTAALSLQSSPRHHLIPHAPYLMLGLQVGVFLLAIPALQPRWARGARAMLGLWTLLYTWALLTGALSSAPLLSFVRALSVFVPALFLMALCYSDPEPFRTFVRVARGLVLFGTLLSLGGIAIFLAWHLDARGIVDLEPWRGIVDVQSLVVGRAPITRLASLTENPNLLATWLMLTTLLTLALYFTRGLSLTATLTASLLQWTALALTFSRAGIGTALLMATALVVHHLWVTRRRPMAGLALGVVAGAALGALLLFRATGVPGSAGRWPVSLSQRDLLWTATWEAILRDPLTGVGFSISQEALLAPLGFPRSTHSVHLAALAEMGLPGYLLLLAFWLGAIGLGIRASRRLRGDRHRRTIAATGVIILSGLLLHQSFELTLTRFGFLTCFWVYLAAVLTHGAWTEPGHPPAPKAVKAPSVPPARTRARIRGAKARRSRALPANPRRRPRPSGSRGH